MDSEPIASSGAIITYAGFWRRSAATVIDMLGLTLLDLALGTLIYGQPWRCGNIINHVYHTRTATWTDSISYGCSTGVGGWSSLVTYWLYFTVLELSPWQAKLGKQLMRFKGTDLEGKRIGFGRGNARYWSKVLSALCLSGFPMIAFTDKKQGLHDKIAKTLVVRG